MPSAPTSTRGQTRTRWQTIARRIRVPLGFVTAAIFLAFAHPTTRLLFLGSPIVLAGLALRAYAAGFVKKNAELTCTGPYAHTRNPLYLGSMLIASGIAVASGRVWLAALLAALFALIYIPTIRSEEAFLRATFPTFPDYARQVPRLLPRLTPARFPAGLPAPTSSAPTVPAPNTPAPHFSRARFLHHREYNSSMGAAAIYAALILRMILLR